MAPKVSVLVAAYNAAPFIAETIESVREQGERDWELILVDDGSTDETVAIAATIAQTDPRITIIQQSNAGAQIARNNAFAASTGKYIVILDADDRLLPEKFDRQVRLLDSLPEYGVVYGDTWHCDERMRRVILESEKYTKQHVSGDVFEKIICGNLFAVHAGMVRRECIERVGLHDHNPELIADWDFWVRIAEKYRFYYHPEPVAEYRFHQGMSVQKDAPLKQLKQRLGVAKKIYQMERFKTLSRQSRARCEFAHGRFASLLGQKKTAWAFYTSALKMDPLCYKAIGAMICLILGIK